MGETYGNPYHHRVPQIQNAFFSDDFRIPHFQKASHLEPLGFHQHCAARLQLSLPGLLGLRVWAAWRLRVKCHKSRPLRQWLQFDEHAQMKIEYDRI